MNFNEAPKKSEEKADIGKIIEKSSMPVLDDSLIADKLKQSPENINTQFVEVPLSSDEKNISARALSEKYNLSLNWAYAVLKKGYRLVDNPVFTSTNKEKLEKAVKVRKFLEEVTPIAANSIETLLGNTTEQALIKEIINSYDASYKYYPSEVISKKRFKLLNGIDVSFGDLVVLNKWVEMKLYRNNGELMKFNEDKATPFYPTNFFGQNKGCTYRDSTTREEVNSSQAKSISLESFAPEVFKAGIFKEEDFDRRQYGSVAYEVNGPHERKLSDEYPYAFLTNNNGSAKYYLGRENFIGTNKKINHETVRVTLLDNETAAITDTINGRKVILYTFPLITKEQYEKKKEEVLVKEEAKGNDKKININDKIFIGASELSDKLASYAITNYIQKNKNEKDVDYAERISKLSDTSYVLGSFRIFISETGLAANNYSWREQLVLADALTNIDQKNKIVDFGRKFGKNGLRTFLSVEQGGGAMGDKIINLGQNLPESISRNVFAKYGEIIDSADKAENEVKKLYEKENIPENVFLSIKETLLKKGVELLSNLSDEINSSTSINEREILQKLEDIKTSTIIMGASYIELYKQGIKVPIEDIKNTTIEKILAADIDQAGKSELLNVYEKGRPNETYQNDEHLKLLKDEFEQTLSNKDTFVFNVRFNGEIVSFATFYKENEDTLHIGGLTFIDDVRNPAVGAAVMSSIMNEFSDFNIKALVHSENKVLRMYQNKFGFKIVKELPLDQNAGELYYEIERPKNSLSKSIEINDSLDKAA